eukprot:Pgem_evm1s1075
MEVQEGCEISFQNVLENEQARNIFMEKLICEASEENLLFWEAVEKYKKNSSLYFQKIVSSNKIRNHDQLQQAKVQPENSLQLLLNLKKSVSSSNLNESTNTSDDEQYLTHREAKKLMVKEVRDIFDTYLSPCSEYEINLSAKNINHIIQCIHGTAMSDLSAPSNLSDPSFTNSDPFTNPHLITHTDPFTNPHLTSQAGQQKTSNPLLQTQHNINNFSGTSQKFKSHNSNNFKIKTEEPKKNSYLINNENNAITSISIDNDTDLEDNNVFNTSSTSCSSDSKEIFLYSESDIDIHKLDSKHNFSESKSSINSINEIKSTSRTSRKSFLNRSNSDFTISKKALLVEVVKGREEENILPNIVIMDKNDNR